MSLLLIAAIAVGAYLLLGTRQSALSAALGEAAEQLGREVLAAAPKRTVSLREIARQAAGASEKGFGTGRPYSGVLEKVGGDGKAGADFLTLVQADWRAGYVGVTWERDTGPISAKGALAQTLASGGARTVAAIPAVAASGFAAAAIPVVGSLAGLFLSFWGAHHARAVATERAAISRGLLAVNEAVRALREGVRSGAYKVTDAVAALRALPGQFAAAVYGAGVKKKECNAACVITKEVTAFTQLAAAELEGAEIVP